MRRGIKMADTQPADKVTVPSSKLLDAAAQKRVEEALKDLISKEIEAAGLQPSNLTAGHVSWS